MQLAPNGSIIDGIVREVREEQSGFGRQLIVDVKQVSPMSGKRDFLKAKKGARLSLFLADPVKVKVGTRYRFATSVLGGPSGQRAIVEKLTKTGIE